METTVNAPVGGTVTQVAVEPNDALDAGDLIVYIDVTVKNGSPDPTSSFESDSEGEDIDPKAALAASAAN
eukprot:349961-Chlamydomonas_euryale.AAC.12